MNTMKNKIGVPEKQLIDSLTYDQLLQDGKSNGFTMIVINDKVYSIEQLISCPETAFWCLENLPLFHVSDLEDNVNQKFINNDYQTLYSVAMNMADNVVVRGTLPDRFSKLEEEYQELVEAFAAYNKANVVIERKHTHIKETFIDKDAEKHLAGEIADVHFVLLHAASLLGLTAFDLLHMASSKMLARLNDPKYVAKN